MKKKAGYQTIMSKYIFYHPQNRIKSTSHYSLSETLIYIRNGL